MDTRQIINSLKDPRLWIIATAVALCLIIAILTVSLSKCSSGGSYDEKSLAVAEALDSMEQRLPGGTGFVVKFPCERRHCLFYLNGGHLYKFDGITKRLDEVVFTSLTEETAIYYNDDDLNAGIREAVLSPDKEYIMLTAAVSPTGADGKAMQGLYKMNTVNLTIDALAQGYVSREGDLFFVSVIDKVSGKPRAMLGFDKWGKQISREKQQAILKKNNSDMAQESAVESTEGDNSAASVDSDNATPTVNNGAGTASSTDASKSDAQESHAKPTIPPTTTTPTSVSDKE